MVAEVNNIHKADFYCSTYGRYHDQTEIESSFIGYPIENPASIMLHFLQSELNFLSGVNEDDWIKAEQVTFNWKLGFSVPKTINSKKLLESVAVNTPIFPRIRTNAVTGK